MERGGEGGGCACVCVMPCMVVGAARSEKVLKVRSLSVLFCGGTRKKKGRLFGGNVLSEFDCDDEGGWGWWGGSIIPMKDEEGCVCFFSPLVSQMVTGKKNATGDCLESSRSAGGEHSSCFFFPPSPPHVFVSRREIF